MRQTTPRPLPTTLRRTRRAEPSARLALEVLVDLLLDPLLVVRGVGPTRRLQRQHGHFGVRVDEVVQVLDVVRDLGHLGVELLELLLEEPAEPVQGSGNRLEVEVRPGAGVWARLEQYYGVLVPLFVA